MWMINALRCKGDARKTIAVTLCVFFIVFCVFLMLLGFLAKDVWALIYSMEDSSRDGVIIMYTFAGSVLILCIFIMLSLKQDSKTEILIALILLVVLWQVHLVITFVAMVIHLINMPEENRASSVLYRSLPLLTVQGLWLYFISMIWYYWRQLSMMRDFPSYFRNLKMQMTRKKAMRQDQRERLGDVPKKLLAQLTPHPTGIYLADGS